MSSFLFVDGLASYRACIFKAGMEVLAEIVQLSFLFRGRDGAFFMFSCLHGALIVLSFQKPFV